MKEERRHSDGDPKQKRKGKHGHLVNRSSSVNQPKGTKAMVAYRLIDNQHLGLPIAPVFLSRLIVSHQFIDVGLRFYRCQTVKNTNSLSPIGKP